MLKPKVYSSDIFYYEGVIKNTKDIIYFLENNAEVSGGIGEWEDWKTSSDEAYQFGEKKVINSEILKNSKGKEHDIYMNIDNAIKDVLLDYKIKTKKDIGSPQSYGIARYFPGKEMGKHVDFDLKSMDRKELSLVPTISSVLYLNNDYIGGEIEFPHQEVFIKPSAGSMIVFPSTDPFYHKSNKTETGYKYVVPIFCYKKV
jgi:predicted 2-oxoglutarate/Fe(II)-dependent dioxygenase YbiX